MSKRSRSHGLNAIQSSLLWPPGLRSTCLGPAASESGSAVSPRRASRGDLAGQDAPGRGTHRGSTGRGRARVPLGVLGAGASRKTRAGRPRAGPFGVDARRRTHVRAAAPSPSPRPAQAGIRSRHRKAAHRSPRAAKGRGRRPHCSSREAGLPSPRPRAGRGAAAAVERGLAPRLCLPGANRRSPTAAAARAAGSVGRRADGRSLNMDVTVSELLELFLQSPLVTWVSAPGACPIVGAPAPLPPARLPTPPARPAGAPRGPRARGLSRCSRRGPGAVPWGPEVFSTLEPALPALG